MALNFNGMMQGIGAGLTTWGGLLAEQSKRDWEEKMMNAKMDREEHLQTLKINADKQLKQMELDQSAYQWNNLSAAQKSQNDIATEQNSINRLNAENTATYQTGMLGVARQNAASQQTSADAQMLNAQKPTAAQEAFNLMNQQRQELVQRMTEANMPKDLIDHVRIFGTTPTGEKPTVNEQAEVAIAQDAMAQFDKLSPKEKNDLSQVYGIKDAVDYAGAKVGAFRMDSNRGVMGNSFMNKADESIKKNNADSAPNNSKNIDLSRLSTPDQLLAQAIEKGYDSQVQMIISRRVQDEGKIKTQASLNKIETALGKRFDYDLDAIYKNSLKDKDKDKEYSPYIEISGL